MKFFNRWYVPDVHIDCFLYALVAVVGFLQTYLGGDEAAKYIWPSVKFWLNCILGTIGVAAVSIKMFRSDTFSRHKNAQVKNGTDNAPSI